MQTFPAASLAFPVVLQRNAFGPRLVARAGDVWRAMQDVVVDQSNSVGWTPERYVSADRMFIVRTMCVVHSREVSVNESLVGRTWPSRARRDMLFTREVRLFSQRDDALLATATQEWALLTRALEPTRADASLYAAFTVTPGFPSVVLPDFTPGPKTEPTRFSFSTWHLWMDPHGHINHPAYVDYCDEGISRLVASQGRDAQRLSPVAEEVHFRAAIGPDAPITVETTEAGTCGDARVFTHRVFNGEKLAATATMIRRFV